MAKGPTAVAVDEAQRHGEATQKKNKKKKKKK